MSAQNACLAKNIPAGGSRAEMNTALHQNVVATTQWGRGQPLVPTEPPKRAARGPSIHLKTPDPRHAHQKAGAQPPRPLYGWRRYSRAMTFDYIRPWDTLEVGAGVAFRGRGALWATHDVQPDIAPKQPFLCARACLHGHGDTHRGSAVWQGVWVAGVDRLEPPPEPLSGCR